MYLAVVATHILLSLLLIVIILLQPGKGGDPGAAFGGGGSGMFGPRGPTSLLSRATTVIAVMFMVTSITLAYFSNKEILANSDVNAEIDARNAERAKAKEAAEQPADDVTPPTEVPAVPEDEGDEVPAEGDEAP